MRVAALVFRDDRGHDGVAAGKGDADPQDALLIFSQVGKFVLHCPVFFLEVCGVLPKDLSGIGELQGNMADEELAVQFLPVTLKTNYLDDELKQIISPVYEMLKNNTIDFEQWNKIQVLLPEVEAYQSWDRCLRVRIALKNKGCSEIV